MKLSFTRLQIATIAGTMLGACVHTPPGTSVELALAKRAEVVRLPVAEVARTSVGTRIPPVEPDLPRNDKVEQVAEAFTRGQFCMEAGKDREAIVAFEEAVKLDPSFTEAWSKLAMLYEKIGDEKKAIEAFRKSKKIARQ